MSLDLLSLPALAGWVALAIVIDLIVGDPRALPHHTHITVTRHGPPRVVPSDFSVIAADLFPLPHRCPNSFHNLTGHVLRGVSDCPLYRPASGGRHTSPVPAR